MITFKHYTNEHGKFHGFLAVRTDENGNLKDTWLELVYGATAEEREDTVRAQFTYTHNDELTFLPEGF